MGDNFEHVAYRYRPPAELTPFDEPDWDYAAADDFAEREYMEDSGWQVERLYRKEGEEKMSSILRGHGSLSDLEFSLWDAIRFRFYRARLLANFYNDVKVRQYADKMEAIFDEYDDEE